MKRLLVAAALSFLTAPTFGVDPLFQAIFTEQAHGLKPGTVATPSRAQVPPLEHRAARGASARATGPSGETATFSCDIIGEPGAEYYRAAVWTLAKWPPMADSATGWPGWDPKFCPIASERCLERMRAVLSRAEECGAKVFEVLGVDRVPATWEADVAAARRAVELYLEPVSMPTISELVEARLLGAGEYAAEHPAAAMFDWSRTVAPDPPHGQDRVDYETAATAMLRAGGDVYTATAFATAAAALSVVSDADRAILLDVVRDLVVAYEAEGRNYIRPVDRIFDELRRWPVADVATGEGEVVETGSQSEGEVAETDAGWIGGFDDPEPADELPVDDVLLRIDEAQTGPGVGVAVETEFPAEVGPVAGFSFVGDLTLGQLPETKSWSLVLFRLVAADPARFAVSVKIQKPRRGLPRLIAVADQEAGELIGRSELAGDVVVGIPCRIAVSVADDVLTATLRSGGLPFGAVVLGGNFQPFVPGRLELGSPMGRPGNAAQAIGTWRGVELRRSEP